MGSEGSEETAGSRQLRVAGLFAGIGGIELGLHRAGHHTSLLCEIDPHASAVLAARFPGVDLVGDVRDIDQLPDVDLVAAGFPCQDLSQAGRTAGIAGSQSGLVAEVFRLIRTARRTPRYLLLENVPFMLHLDRGEGMRYLTRELEALGMRWAYRIVDTRAFGLPHRRQRVVLIASHSEDPMPLLFSSDAGPPPVEPDYTTTANGFYWTEGLRGLGWAVDAVPTLKGGSTIGIPSAPAIWLPDGTIGMPSIEDAERLQGFEAGWTLPGVQGQKRQGARWKMVGNAVSVPMAAWIGRQLAHPPRRTATLRTSSLPIGLKWPAAASGGQGRETVAVDVSMWPVRADRPPLRGFLQAPVTPLSVRACDGFLARAERSTLRFPPGLLEAIRAHRRRMASQAMALAS